MDKYVTRGEVKKASQINTVSTSTASSNTMHAEQDIVEVTNKVMENDTNVNKTGSSKLLFTRT